MEDKDFFGKLVYLTPHLEHWLKEVNPQFNIPMSNRIARIIKVFDWDSEEGKLLITARLKTGKWNVLDPKEFKFVLKIYYPDLVRGDKKGVTVEEVVPRYYPKTKLEMFGELPDWMISDFKSEQQIEEFSLIGTKPKYKTKKVQLKSKTKITKVDKTSSPDKKVIAIKLPRKNVPK